jgi:hypothetical protein
MTPVACLLFPYKLQNSTNAAFQNVPAALFYGCWCPRAARNSGASPPGALCPRCDNMWSFYCYDLSVCRTDDTSSGLTGRACSLFQTTANLRLSEANGCKRIFRRPSLLTHYRVFRNIFTFGCMPL